MAQKLAMSWKSIRLELARTGAFPAGSVSRAFLLRLPLTDTGAIDWDQVSTHPSRATVRRFWGSEPDRRGIIKRNDKGWAVKESLNGGGSMFQMRPQPIRLGEEVEVTLADGDSLPFKVARINAS